MTLLSANGLKARGIAPPQDPRLSRIKLLVLDVKFLITLLQLDGSYLVKMAGWPAGCVVMGHEGGDGDWGRWQAGSASATDPASSRLSDCADTA